MRIGQWAVSFPWNNVENLEKWNPARPDLLSNLEGTRNTNDIRIIHREKDYRRCSVTDRSRGINMTLYSTLGVQRQISDVP